MTPFNRRDLLRSAGIITFAGAAATTGRTEPALVATAATSVPGFVHRVASGGPLPDSVLLWTHVTSTTGSLPGSEVGPGITVGLEMAEDSGFLRIVASGSAATGPDRDHTFKVISGGLQPGAVYW